MNDEQSKQNASRTQELVSTLNTNLENIRAAIVKMGEAEANTLKLAAAAYDMSYLVVRALAEMHVDFKTTLLRLAHEPAIDPIAQESRDLLIRGLAGTQKSWGQRPTLKPVPPSTES